MNRKDPAEMISKQKNEALAGRAEPDRRYFLDGPKGFAAGPHTSS